MASRGSGFRLAIPLAYFRNFHIPPRQVFRLRVHGVNLLRFASIASGPGCGRLAQGEPNLHVQKEGPRTNLSSLVPDERIRFGECERVTPKLLLNPVHL